MRIEIKGINLPITDAIRDYGTKKLEAFEKFVHAKDTGASLAVEIEKVSNRHKTGDLFRVVGIARIGDKTFSAEIENIDIYAGIDAMRDGLKREITSWKGKSIALIRRSAGKLKNVVKGMWKR